MIMSGSHDKFPSAALFFERDGSIILHLSSDISDEEEKSISLASEFFQYALQKQEWLLQFLDEEYLEEDAAKEENLPPPKLYVIQGGLSSGSHTL